MTAAAATRPTVTGLAAWRPVLIVGLIFAGLALYVTLVGIVGTFQARNLITDVVTVGQMVLLLTGFVAGYVAAQRAPAGPSNAIIGAGIAGLMSGAALLLLILVGPLLGLRAYLPNASPALYDLLTLEMGTDGFWVPALLGLTLGVLGGILSLLPRHVRVLFILGLGGLIVMGLFAGLLRSPWLQQPLLAGLARDLFASNGLTQAGAWVVVGIVAIAYAVHVLLRPARRVRELPRESRRAAAIPMSLILLLIVLLIPLPATVAGLPNVFSLGPLVASSVAFIALYVLMGLGLNITLGLAGLLDLGFVAFFAVGAYTVGLLTSTAEYGIAQWPFWAAIPFAVLAAMLFGLVLGLPILGIRGDYLAIATLGFGEIIRLLSGSELLKPILGGPRGILEIPKPINVPPDDPLAGPNQIYYISLILAAIIAFVAYRLRASRLGRAWIALREDEDVAEALGVNLVQTKSLAYMLGAAFAGLGGAVFAALYGSIISSSIRLDISIQVVAIIIIGGMGSIPGVVLGAIFLIGLPELFREFAQYRFLFYGLALILIMRLRPEGLLPSRVGRQEMHAQDEQAPPPEPDEDIEPAASGAPPARASGEA
jgi:branched-chain amino acid transport system permease protein